jgi:hypothetical protein
MRHRTVFIDESGDLGFSLRSSKHFAVVALVSPDPTTLERIPKRVRRRKLRKSLRRKPELKFHNSNPDVRRLVLRMIAEVTGTRIFCVIVEKRRSLDPPYPDSIELYQHACGTLLRGVLRSERIDGDLQVVLDARRGNRKADIDLDLHLRSEIASECRSLGLIPPDRIRMSRYDSHSSGGLQVVDFVAGAVRRKYEEGDDSYYRIVLQLIALEKSITP